LEAEAHKRTKYFALVHTYTFSAVAVESPVTSGGLRMKSYWKSWGGAWQELLRIAAQFFFKDSV